MSNSDRQERELQKNHDPRLAAEERTEPEQSRLVLNFYSEKTEGATIVSLASSPLTGDESVPKRFDLSDSQCCN